MKITRLARGKTQQRINVEIDGEFAFSVNENTLIKFNLFGDKTLSKKETDEIKNYDLIEYLQVRALDMISRRPRSVNEIQLYLSNKLQKRLYYSGINIESQEDIIAEVTKRLEEKEYLDDESFTRWFTSSRIKSKKKSKRQVEQELYKFGINKDIYRPILDELFPAQLEQEFIEELIEKKRQESRIRKNTASKQKLMIQQYLSRKGFNWDQIRKPLEKIYAK